MVSIRQNRARHGSGVGKTLALKTRAKNRLKTLKNRARSYTHLDGVQSHRCVLCTDGLTDLDVLHGAMQHP